MLNDTWLYYKSLYNRVLFEQTTSPIVSDLCCRVQTLHKKIDMWYPMIWHELGWYVFEQRVTRHMSCLAEWTTVRWGPPPTPVCQVVMTEGWLWHAVSLWWNSWNLIMIPNHRTCMIPLWHCELGYRVGWWHGCRRTAYQRKKTCACCGIFWTLYVTDNINMYMFVVQHQINILPTYICYLKKV